MAESLPSTIHNPEKPCHYNSVHLQELIDAKEFFQFQHNKYRQYKILYDTVQEGVCNSNLWDNELQLKVQDVLFEDSCAQVIDLENGGFTDDSSNIFGLLHMDKSELTCDESIKLKQFIDLILQEKYNNICKEFIKITGENINLISSTSKNYNDFDVSSEDINLLELRGKVEHQQKIYTQNLLKEKGVLEDLVKLRLEKLPKVCEEKIKECEVISRKCELQTKIVQDKTRVEIFGEALPAYRELIKDVKIQQEECQQDIQYLQKLKEKYKLVACKQFDELLKSFIQYKSSLEKKKLMYESLQR
jgi:hypothetical protein